MTCFYCGKEIGDKKSRQLHGQDFHDFCVRRKGTAFIDKICSHRYQEKLKSINPDLSIEEVEVQEQEKWVDENYKEGTMLEIGFCDYCDEWEYDDRRCSCGNRRVCLNVEGNLLDGYYAYPEPF